MQTVLCREQKLLRGNVQLRGSRRLWQPTNVNLRLHCKTLLLFKVGYKVSATPQPMKSLSCRLDLTAKLNWDLFFSLLR